LSSRRHEENGLFTVKFFWLEEGGSERENKEGSAYKSMVGGVGARHPTRQDIDVGDPARAWASHGRVTAGRINIDAADTTV
jgi:hypothetical protein